VFPPVLAMKWRRCEALSKGDLPGPSVYVSRSDTRECRAMPFCVQKKTNLCQAIRWHPGRRLMPDAPARFLQERQPI